MCFKVNGHTCGHSIRLYESTEDIVNPASALTVLDTVLYMIGKGLPGKLFYMQTGHVFSLFQLRNNFSFPMNYR